MFSPLCVPDEPDPQMSMLDMTVIKDKIGQH